MDEFGKIRSPHQNEKNGTWIYIMPQRGRGLRLAFGSEFGQGCATEDANDILAHSSRPHPVSPAVDPENEVPLR